MARTRVGRAADRDQGSLFYAFRLDDRVAKDHLLSVTAALGGMHARLKPYYSEQYP